MKIPVQRKSKQRGISFVGPFISGAIIAVICLVFAQVFPTVIEFMAVQRAAQKAASEGETPAGVRLVFDKASAIDEIKVISSKDLDVTKQGDKVVVGYNYRHEIHLLGPAYLTLKYEGRSK
jgi:hypothetical protein